MITRSRTRRTAAITRVKSNESEVVLLVRDLRNAIIRTPPI